MILGHSDLRKSCCNYTNINIIDDGLKLYNHKNFKVNGTWVQNIKYCSYISMGLQTEKL